MTILGFNLVSPWRAVAWCDSEVYEDREPVGDTCKMAVNALAGTVGIGSGTVGIVRAAGAALGQCTSFDEAAATLPAALCQAKREAIDLRAARPSIDFARYAITGRSDRFGRIMAYRFRAERDFQPELTHSWHSPTVDTGAAIAEDEDGVRCVAQQQIAELNRGDLPNATGGTLLMATIEGARITCWPMFRFRPGSIARDRA